MADLNWKELLTVSNILAFVFGVLLLNSAFLHIGGMGSDDSDLQKQIDDLQNQYDSLQGDWNEVNKTAPAGCDCEYNASTQEAAVSAAVTEATADIQQELDECQNETGGDALTEVLDSIASYSTITKKSFLDNIDNSAGLKYPNIKLGKGTPKFFSLASGDTQAILDAVPEGMGDQEALRYIQSTLEGQFTENEVPTVFTSYETKENVQIVKRIFFLEEAQDDGEDVWYKAYFTEDGKTKNSVTADEDGDSAYRVRNFD